MKYIAFILSVYIFCLASAPCVDEGMSIHKQDPGQTEHQPSGTTSDHADACSPFCICSCCSVPVTIAPVTVISQPFSSFKRPVHPGSTAFLSFFDMTFWQPPKIG
ncbi:MAG: hypothetical protein NT040_00660 [Bacteroidetes bacterium]|nr:hypothetical protein [Bacteroidota bacterium]